MKKILLAATILIFGMVGMANASPIAFVIDGGGSSVTSSDSAALADIKANLVSNLGGTGFTLADGETKTIEFFTLTATGFYAKNKNYTVGATLAFATPKASSSGSGGGSFSTIFGLVSGGTLTWEPATLPDYLKDGFGNTFSVNFESGRTLGFGNTATVHAYVTNTTVTNTTAPVPEPGTMLLMGVGIAGFGGCNRKRFIKKAYNA
jgi:hypothetical protein